MNDALGAIIKRKIIAAGEAGMREFVEAHRDATKETISVPVEYDRGMVIRSKEGEEPRKELGTLHDSIKSDVQVEESRVIGLVYTDDVKGKVLGLDGPYLNRPFWTRAKVRVREGADDLKARISKNFSTSAAAVAPR